VTRDEWFEALAEWHAELRRRIDRKERVTVGERLCYIPHHLMVEAVNILGKEGREVGPR
jgi:hypothetical protein